LKLPILEIFSELQLMEDKDIFGIITGMIIDIRAPKSNVWVSMIAVFI
jgi:hypothetical protein